MTDAPVNIGWEFDALRPSGEVVPIYFTTSGSYSYDATREVTKAIGGFVLIPSEREKLDLSSDVILAYLVLDDIRYSMGRFLFVEDVVLPDVVLDPLEPDNTMDLTNVALADISTLLVRNTGAAQTLYAGFDPAQEILRLGLGVSTRFGSIADAQSADTTTVTWDGSTTDLSKIRQLAELAGHRPPWTDNDGILRSVQSGSVYGDLIPMAELFPEAQSISITNSYLNAPNRVIVTDNSSGAAITGIWNAPASAPNSEARRGYVRTETVNLQGLSSAAHAEIVAKTLGESFTARKLTMNILPTNKLDGPRVVSYKDALWLVTSWSVGTGSGQLLEVQCEELLLDITVPSISEAVGNVS